MNPESPTDSPRPKPWYVTHLAWLRSTPFHPLWLGQNIKKYPARSIREQMHGVVLDIGCADGGWRSMLSPGCRYIGLDYYHTAREWYGTRPQVFGNAEQLPLASGSCHGVMLLNVLEHLPHPGKCLAEIRRVLAPGGAFLMQVPFLYPLHDLPLDFQRFTPNGLEELAKVHGFQMESLETLGHSVETAALFLNIALSRGFLDLLARRHPLFLLVILLPVLVLSLNLAAKLGALLLPANPMICQSLLTLWRKPVNPPL